MSVPIRVFGVGGSCPCVSSVARSRFSLFSLSRLLFGTRPRWSRLVSPRSRVNTRHLGESDVKQAVEEQEMRGSDLAEAMASTVDRIVNARCRVITRVRVEGRDHGGLGLRRRGEGIGLRNGA